MDFINGGELFWHLQKKKKFAESRAAVHAAEITTVLIYLHKQGVLYRDLKPENLLVDKEGHLRVIDLGLAKQNMKPNDLTSTFCGTPEYMAPEIIKKEGYCFSSDWYALGCLIYEMLTGFPPHFHQNSNKVM